MEQSIQGGDESRGAMEAGLQSTWHEFLNEMLGFELQGFELEMT